MWNWFVGRMMAIGAERAPDFVVGGHDAPYLRRRFVIPRNPFFNIYLHQFLRDDDDRALHDHPWAWCSILLQGGYVEHSAAGAQARYAPSVKFSGPRRPHRVALFPAWWGEDDLGAALAISRQELGGRESCWTRVLTGPRVRTWGFHCPKGWVPWQEFVAPNDSGSVGRGCGDGE